MALKYAPKSVINLSREEISLLQEELDIDDEMNEESEPEIDDDPYFLLAQRLANAPQVKVNPNIREEGEVQPGGNLAEEEEFEKKCPVCLIEVPIDITEHFKLQHPDIEGVVCPHCYKLLSKKCTLNRHIEQVHLGLQIFKPAKCDECGKVFSKKGHLDRHVRTIHMGMKDESEPCPHCGKIFTTKSSLEPHIEAVHKGIRRECKICGKVLSDLWKHMRTVHGQYRRKIKIPKEEVFGTNGSNSGPSQNPLMLETSSISLNEFEEHLEDQIALPMLPLPLNLQSNLQNSEKKNLQNSNSENQKKKSGSKRKSSSPLKVKMPFKLSSSSLEKTKEQIHDNFEEI